MTCLAGLWGTDGVLGPRPDEATQGDDAHVRLYGPRLHGHNTTEHNAPQVSLAFQTFLENTARLT